LSITLVGLRFVVSPAGMEEAERLIVPENPPNPLRVMVELPDEPGFRIMKVGLAVRLNATPVTWTWMKVLRIIVPLVPVM